MEQYTYNFRDEVQKLLEENQEKTTAIANLSHVMNNKSLEVNTLREEAEQTKKENDKLYKQLQDTKLKFGSSVLELENDKQNALCSLQLARQESQELLQKVKDYDELVQKQDNLSKSLVSQEQDHNEIKKMLMDAIEENNKLKLDLVDRENDNVILLQELHRLRDNHQNAIANINNLQEENRENRLSLALSKKDSEILEEKLKQSEDLKKHLEAVQSTNQKLQSEKLKLEGELKAKADELDDTVHVVELTKKESEKLLEKVQQSESLKDNMIKLSTNYQNLVSVKENLLSEIADKKKDFDNLLQTLNQLKVANEKLLEKSNNLKQEIEDSKKAYNDLLREKNALQTDYDSKCEELNNLYNTLESKIEENRDLLNQVKYIQLHHKEAENSIAALHDEKMNAQTTLTAVRRESDVLMDKLKQYGTLANKYDQLKKDHDQICEENERLMGELETQLKDFVRLVAENQKLNIHTQNLTTQNEDLEAALIGARTEVFNILKIIILLKCFLYPTPCAVILFAV